MKRGLLWLGFGVVCLPMVFAVWLLAASSLPWMDGVTQHLPLGMKKLVATSIVNLHQNRKSSWARAEKIDRGAARSAEQQLNRPTLAGIENDMSISTVNGKVFVPEGLRKKARDLDAKARELEKAHDYCGAEDVYTRAAGGMSSTNDYWHTESMGKAGLLCGDLAGARAGLETSLEMANRYLATDNSDEDDVADTKNDMLQAREYLIVVYDRQKEKALSATTCKAAHPDWKKCGCAVKDDGVKCVEKR